MDHIDRSIAPTLATRKNDLATRPHGLIAGLLFQSQRQPRNVFIPICMTVNIAKELLVSSTLHWLQDQPANSPTRLNCDNLVSLPRPSISVHALD